ncbi:MAG TPA: hypothetical protein VE131_07405 [Terriglobales bacterium]|nr:hypothetical protein [Terriglobales bacterium]
MAEAIVYLLILICVVGVPWLTMTIMIKPKRRKRQGANFSFENYLATAVSRGGASRRPGQARAEKLAPVADESPQADGNHAKSSALCFLPHPDDAAISHPERRLLLAPPRCETKT